MDAVHTHHYTPSEFGKKCAKYAKCARWTITQREAESRRASVEKYAKKVCNVCRHGCSHTLARTCRPKAERAPKKAVSIRLRAAVKRGRLHASACCRHARCTLFILCRKRLQKSMHRQKPPRRTPACSCILCILFILFLNIERDIRRREEHMKWMQCTPTTTHPVSSEKSVQSMQSALAEL